MDDSSTSDGEGLMPVPTVASILGVKGSLRFRPHGSSQKAHVVLRRVELSDNSDDDGEAKPVVYFSLFAQKRIEVKPGKEILLAVASPDGTFTDQAVIFEGDVLRDDHPDSDVDDDEETLVPQETAIPPKMRRTWSKRIDESHKDLDNLIPAVSPPTRSSIAIQTEYAYVSTSVQAVPPPPPRCVSISIQAEPVCVSQAVQVSVAPPPPHVSAFAQTADPVSGNDVMDADPIPSEDKVADSGVAILQESPNAASDVPIMEQPRSPSLESSDAMLSDMDQGSERSLSPMDIDSPSSTPPQSPVVRAMNIPVSLPSLKHMPNLSRGTSMTSVGNAPPSPLIHPHLSQIRDYVVVPSSPSSLLTTHDGMYSPSSRVHSPALDAPSKSPSRSTKMVPEYFSSVVSLPTPGTSLRDERPPSLPIPESHSPAASPAVADLALQDSISKENIVQAAGMSAERVSQHVLNPPLPPLSSTNPLRAESSARPPPFLKSSIPETPTPNRRPVVRNPFISGGFMTEFVGASTQPVKDLEMSNQKLENAVQAQASLQLLAHPMQPSQPSPNVKKSSSPAPLAVLSSQLSIRPLAVPSASNPERSGWVQRAAPTPNAIASSSKAPTRKMTPPNLSAISSTANGRSRELSPASPPGLTYRSTANLSSLTTKLPSSDIHAPPFLKWPPSQTRSSRPSSPLPPPKSFAFTSSGPSSNPPNIQPSSHVAPQQGASRRVPHPPQPSHSAAKKRVIVGSGWPHTRHTPATTPAIPPDVLSTPSATPSGADGGTVLPKTEDPDNLFISTPPELTSSSAPERMSFKGHSATPTRTPLSLSTSFYDITYDPSLSPSTPPGLSHIRSYSPSPPPSSNASSSGQPSKWMIAPSIRQLPVPRANGQQASHTSTGLTVTPARTSFNSTVTEGTFRHAYSILPAALNGHGANTSTSLWDTPPKSPSLAAKIEAIEHHLTPQPSLDTGSPSYSSHCSPRYTPSTHKPLTPSHSLPPGPPYAESPSLYNSRGTKRAVSPDLHQAEPARPHKKLQKWPTLDCAYSTPIVGDGEVSVQHIAFNSDGSQFAVSCHDWTIRIWDNLKQAEIARLSNPTALVTFAWMDGDAGIITLAGNGVVSKWTRSGQSNWQWAKVIDAGFEIRQDEDSLCLAYMRDRIAVSSSRIGVKVWMWVKGNWQPQRSILRQNVTSIIFVEDGDALLGGTRDGVLWYCQVPNGTLRAYAFFKSKVLSIDVSPSSAHVLVTQAGGVSHLVGIRQDDHKGKIEQVYATKDTEDQPTSNHQFGAVFANKEGSIIFGSVDGCLLVWNRAKGDVVCGLDHGEEDTIQAVASYRSPLTLGNLVTGTKRGQLYWWPQPPTPGS